MNKSPVSKNVIRSQKVFAENYLEDADIDISDEDIEKEGLNELDIMIYEWRKCLQTLLLEEAQTVVGIDGHDSGGKTKTSRTITSEEDVYGDGIIQRESLPKPNKRQNDMRILDRYKTFFPGKGKTVVFDRTWNNRAFVQWLNGYCTEEQYKSFMKSLKGDLMKLQDEGYDLTHYFFYISQVLQEQNLNERKESHRHNFRYSDSDQRAVENHPRLSEQVEKVSEIYKAAGVPFTIIRGDDKSLIPIELLKEFLRNRNYIKKTTRDIFSRNTALVAASIGEILEVERTKNI